MPYKSANPIASALFGGLLAVVIAFALCYAGLWARVANVTAPGAPPERGAAALMRVGLNLYAMQHVTLAGSGTVTSEFSGTQPVSDSITLPLNIWALIPAIALVIGGYAAGARRRGNGVAGIVAPAVLAGVIYALVLTACRFVVGAKLSLSAIPSVNGVSFSPHDIVLHPGVISTLLSTGFFGVFFAYLGGMLASRGERGLRGAGQWWVCGKAIILTALLIQALVVAGIGVWLHSRAPMEMFEGSSRWQVFTISPTAAGAAYSYMHGVMVSGAVVSPLQDASEAPAGKADLYTGLGVTGKPNQPTKPTVLYGIFGVVILAALAAGGLAVRWGSRDGSLQTSLRIALLLAVYLYVLAFLCTFGWASREGPDQFTVTIGLHLGASALISLFAVFCSALLGAYLTTTWYVSRRGFPSGL